jgi:pimeloyl-ACP methyl ester carboxylesterase
MLFDISDLERNLDKEFVGMESATAQETRYGSSPGQGLYVTPKGKSPKVALIAAHYNVDFSEHYMAPYIARHGYGFLGWNTRYRNAEDQFLLEHAVLDIGVGIDWLRKVKGVETVVIVGNSGGGSLMAAYQAEAIAPTLGHLLPSAGQEALEQLDKADLYISLNAHEGRPIVFTNFLDASVVDEWDPVPTDQSLNPFNPDNGPPFSEEFITRYRAAQKARNQRITDWAKAELKRVNDAGIPDRLFPVYRSQGDLRFLDPSIDPSERVTPMCLRGDPYISNNLPGSGRFNNLKTWLSMWSLETSLCKGPPQLAKITQPSLVIQGLGDPGVFPSDARSIFESLGTSDKDLHLISGEHYFEEARASREKAADIMASWIASKI